MRIFAITLVLLVIGTHSDYIAFMYHNKTMIPDCPCDCCYQATGGPFGNYIQCAECTKNDYFKPFGYTIDLGCGCDEGGHSYTLYSLFDQYRNNNRIISCTTDEDISWHYFKNIVDSLYFNMTGSNEPYDWEGEEHMCWGWAFVWIVIGSGYAGFMLVLLFTYPLYLYIKKVRGQAHKLQARESA